MGHLCEKEEKKRKKKNKRKKEWGEKCVMRLRNGSDISIRDLFLLEVYFI
jgi:hypothetical protein